MERSNQITVAIVDQHVLFTQCLAMALELRNYSCRVLPEPDEAPEAGSILGQLLAMRPDVVLVNADLGPYCSGVELVEPLVRAGIAVVVITESIDEPLWGRCLARGARTVLSKSAQLTSAIAVVRRVSQGQLVLDRSERDRLIAVHRRYAVQQRELREHLRRLTIREREILRHLVAGVTVREIAARRVVSEATVRSQVKAVLRKLDVSSQIAAVAVARQAGWSAPIGSLAS
ncbi:response regulator transcription factor [Nocardioides sp. URHA0020]|uniref:response regulator transcription factor n=1 Tax=Nocardioides sp. URHA0020 TaxID=1380392 RepID=UPI000562BE9F|nr:response regulator transcription factor [Nocardioides sp. URHA0020]